MMVKCLWSDRSLMKTFMKSCSVYKLGNVPVEYAKWISNRSESKSSEREKLMNDIKSRAQRSKPCTLIGCFPPPALYS